MTPTPRARILAVLGLGAAMAAASFVAGIAYAAQPHMQAALGHLQAARGELQAAEQNKAGHRESALRLVNEAIGQVQAGISAGS